ncbi:hypothetical protein TIFTF001_007186 [Ficus carica]|uniref:Uncharacterized protein n=1 Tax=Ficus carica TaxID=3494 RepID=A0AA87ZKP9_FICCA|nr:hypothetical protein TIFTF001_007186 [Ficus carica]
MSRCSENSKMEEDTGKRPMLFTELGATHGGNLVLTTEFLPSTTAEAAFTIPDYTSSQFSMRFLHRDATLWMTAAQRPFPAIELAATISNPSIAFGLVVG